MEISLTCYNKFACGIANAFIASLNFDQEGDMDVDQRNKLIGVLKSLSEEAISKHSPSELAKIIATVPDLEKLDVGEEFYGANAEMLLRGILSCALGRTFSDIRLALFEGTTTGSLKALAGQIVTSLDS
jgi:hypothetical protein